MKEKVKKLLLILHSTFLLITLLQAKEIRKLILQVFPKNYFLREVTITASFLGFFLSNKYKAWHIEINASFAKKTNID